MTLIILTASAAALLFLGVLNERKLITVEKRMGARLRAWWERGRET
jgi:hypothetical protein